MTLELHDPDKSVFPRRTTAAGRRSCRRRGSGIASNPRPDVVSLTALGLPSAAGASLAPGREAGRGRQEGGGRGQLP